MIDAGSLAPLIDGISALPQHQVHGYIPEPQESHRLFGASFLFIGALLLVETIAGRVWHRNRLRTLVWPGAIMMLGAGMVVVTVLEPNDRVIHFTIGLIMLAGGVYEARHRLGYISRSRANLIVVPALIAGGLEIGVFHFHGSLDSQSAIAHVLLGLTAGVMAVVRVYQARQPMSVPRSAYMGFAVVLLGVELLALSH